MATLKTFLRGESVTINFLLNAEYLLENIEEIKIYLGSKLVASELTDRTVSCKIPSNTTKDFGTVNKLTFWLDDTLLGVQKLYVGDVCFDGTNAIASNESIKDVADIVIPITVNETAITVGDVVYNYVKGDKGDTGNGIQSITLLATVGLVKSYRILFTDSTTFDYDVTDGQNGTNGVDGNNGNGIQSITLLSTVGLIKTYRITYTDATTFDYTVTDGADGTNGITYYTENHKEDLTSQVDGVNKVFTLLYAPMDTPCVDFRVSGFEAEFDIVVNGNEVTLSYAPAIGSKVTCYYQTNTTAIPNISGKQDKTDISLATTDKTVVGAIGEVLGIANSKEPAKGTDDNYVTDAEKAALHSHSNKSILDGTQESFTTALKSTYDAKQPAGSYEVTTNKGANNGYAGLDSGGKVPLSQLPSTLLKYIGQWNASTNTPTLTNPDTAKAGYVYDVSVSGTQFGLDFVAGDWLIYNSSGVPELSKDSDSVVSVNGQTGAVTITLVGLGGEATSNKQNTLTVDGTGTKFPTVDAVNGGIANRNLKSANLSDVANTSTARTNLDVYSKSETDAKVADSITDGVTGIAPSQNAVFDALALKQNALNFVAQTANKFLRDDNSFQTIEQAIGGYANNLYFNETASDVGGYETLSYEPEVSTTIESWSVTSTDGDKLLKNYLYPTAVGVTSIPAGLWSVLMYGKVSSATSLTQMGITYFARHTDNSETDLFTVWSDEINNTTDEWISFQITNPAFTLVETDRMGARVKIKTTSTGTRTVTYAVGDGYGAFINNPNRIRHNQLRAHNEDVTVQHIDSNTEKETIIDADSIVIWDSVAMKAVRSTFAHFKTVLATVFAPKIASTTVTANTVIDGTYNAIDSNGTSLSHTLPTAATYPNKEWTITNSNATDCTLVGTVSGDNAISLQDGESLTFYSNGTKLIAK